MTSGPVVVQVLEGDNAVARYREVMGATNPANAADGTIRKLYAKNFGENSVHGSDSAENAKIEIAQFFTEDESSAERTAGCTRAVRPSRPLARRFWSGPASRRKAPHCGASPFRPSLEDERDPPPDEQRRVRARWRSALTRPPPGTPDRAGAPRPARGRPGSPRRRPAAPARAPGPGRALVDAVGHADGPCSRAADAGAARARRWVSRPGKSGSSVGGCSASGPTRRATKTASARACSRRAPRTRRRARAGPRRSPPRGPRDPCRTGGGRWRAPRPRAARRSGQARRLRVVGEHQRRSRPDSRAPRRLRSGPACWSRAPRSGRRPASAHAARRQLAADEGGLAGVQQRGQHRLGVARARRSA